MLFVRNYGVGFFSIQFFSAINVKLGIESWYFENGESSRIKLRKRDEPKFAVCRVKDRDAVSTAQLLWEDVHTGQSAIIHFSGRMNGSQDNAGGRDMFDVRLRGLIQF